MSKLICHASECNNSTSETFFHCEIHGGDRGVREGKQVKTYQIKYTAEKWYKVNISAENEDQARELFFSGEFDEEPRLYGEELQDGIDVVYVGEASA